jgi:alanine racemase
VSRPTIADVARAAGVSTTSVSFAFNNPTRISEATRDRILTIAADLGYIPDPVARSMSTGRTGTIGLLVPQPLTEMARNPHFSEFLAGVARATEARDVPILLVSPQQGSMEHAVYGAAVDGFLTLGLETFRPTLKLLDQRRLPYVMVDSEPVPGIACVNVDDTAGASQAMARILSAGHRHIGILGIRSPQRGTWRNYVGTLARRTDGYQKALSEHGLSLDDTILKECTVSETAGRRGLRRLMEQADQPTAVVAMSDIIALGALEEAARLGLRVPGQLSIIGFDDIPEARWALPPLTTVGQPARNKGHLAAELLIDLIAGTRPPEHIVLETHLIERDTVAAPPSR